MILKKCHIFFLNDLPVLPFKIQIPTQKLPIYIMQETLNMFHIY